MKQIWKFPLTIGAITDVEVSSDAEILSVGCPGSYDPRPVVWILNSFGSPTRKMQFEVFGTGWDIDDRDREFIGTAERDGLVWHVFRVFERCSILKIKRRSSVSESAPAI